MLPHTDFIILLVVTAYLKKKNPHFDFVRLSDSSCHTKTKVNQEKNEGTESQYIFSFYKPSEHQGRQKLLDS